MSTYLLCANPIHGHFTALLGTARHLVSRGHRVIVLTGSRFAERVANAGAEFRALTGSADYDDRDTASYLPDRAKYRGLAQAQYDIQTIFVRPIPEQYRAVMEIVEGEHPDAVLVDSAFGGAGPLLYDPDHRVPVIALGVAPLTQLSRDVAPTGMGLPPASGPLGHLRNRVLNTLATRVLFRRTQQLGVDIMRDLGVSDLDHFILDISGAFDRYLQLCAPGLEYPRSDLTPNATFVGPVPSPASDPSAPLPAWWSDLDGSRPVVHVTQGTIDNLDFGRLVRPTLEGLADLDVLVVVTLGGRPLDALPDVPANARVASYLPYDRFLPLAGVYVTNGGYGGVNHALSAGVPLVVAGDTEDKPEVAARVAWSGVGVNLRTGTPTPAAVRRGVERVLGEGSYRAAARRMQDSIAALDTFALIEAELERAVAARR
ncbi:glycosyltransferase [Schumannella luteola]